MDLFSLTTAAVSVLGILLLIYAGLNVSIALGAVSFVSLWFYSGSFTLPFNLIAAAVTSGVSSYSFGVVPLFIVMGIFVAQSELGSDAYRVANQFFARIKGGLGIATVVANTIFAMITGISIASAAIFSRIAVPEMIKAGYTGRFSTGVVAGSSVLGMLMPPSVLLIIYAIVANQSIAALFQAAVIPALLLASAYVVLILGLSYFKPSFVYDLTRVRSETTTEKLSALKCGTLMAPICVLIIMVLGGIYAGIFTPTEAGAAGAAFALLIALFKRKLTLENIRSSFHETGRMTAGILLLILCATMYSRFIGITGVPSMLASWVSGSGLGLLEVMAIYILMMVCVGMVLDSTSTMLILIPVFLPIVAVLGGDPVWFGVVTVLCAEIALLTPPLGLSVFVVKSSTRDSNISLGEIFLGSFPFALTMVLVLVLLCAMPWLAGG